MEDTLVVRCFCVCSGSVLLGDLLAVSRSMDLSVTFCLSCLILCSGVGVGLKVGGINIEKSEGVGSGEGLCPPQLEVWGLPPEKKSILHFKKYAILSKFWYFFPILQHKVGGIIPRS